MLDAFLQFISKEQLLPQGSRVILALSGGIDSVVMAHLFSQAPWPFAIAHCNFGLRGGASDEDEHFVKALADTLEVPCYATSFDTLRAAAGSGASVQMVARQLRYDWFETIRRQEEYDFVATAHHLNDAIETLLYNLTKGCGISGLHGIPLRAGSVIRPLLFATRADIEAYAGAHKLDYREDASNAEDKYSRNKVRLQVLPALKKINPALEQTMAANLERFKAVEYLYGQALNLLWAEAVDVQEGRRLFSIARLKDHEPALPTILYEWLSPFGFTPSQARQAGQSLDHTGAAFYSQAYRLLVDREHLILEELPPGNVAETYWLDESELVLELPQGHLSITSCQGRPDVFPPSPYEAALDAGQLQFPLLLRHWQEGDVFQPLGMGGRHQKVQDFFTNNKVSRFDKEKAWILEDALGRICWLLGYRIDDRFAIKPGTRAHWVLKYAKV